MSHRERNGPQGRGYSAAGRLARAERRDFDQVKSNDFFAELKQRNVYKVAVAYAVVCWLVVQIATQVLPFFEIPNWAVRLIMLGVPIALVIAWAFWTDSRNSCVDRKPAFWESGSR